MIKNRSGIKGRTFRKKFIERNSVNKGINLGFLFTYILFAWAF